MEQYTTYCTPEQIRKALKLGAPIDSVEEHKVTYTQRERGIYDAHNWRYWLCPTAEQMIGWLESKPNIREVWVYRRLDWHYYIFNNENVEVASDVENVEKILNSRKEATLAAIDAALDYLLEINNTK